MARSQLLEKSVDMIDTEKSNRTTEGELEFLRKRVGELEAEVQVLRRFKPTAREDSDWFRKLIGIMNEAFLILDKDANITYCNERLLEFVGRSEDEVVGRSAFEFVDRDSLDHFGKEFLRRSDGKRGIYEMHIKNRDGQKNPVLCSASPIFNDHGEFQGSISTFTDMRFLKKAQETIKLERDKFQLLAEVSPFGLVLVARDGSFEYMNPKFIEMFGYDYKDIPDGKTWRLKAFPDEDYRREMLNAWVEDLKKTKPGAVRSRVYTIRCKDGTDKIAHFRPVRLSTGQDLMTCEDITDFTKSEIARKKAYSILESAMESTADGILVIDRDRRVSAYNRKFLQIWRIPPEMASSFHNKGILESVLDRIADPNSFMEKVNYLYEHPGEESSDIIEFADGRIIERYTKPQVIGDQIVGRVWSFRDVTVRIELEKELGQAIAELKLANRETRALLNCARIILESDNFRHAAQFILDSSMELTSAEAGNITVMGAGGKEQYLLCFGGRELICDLDLNQPIPLKGLYQYVYDQKKAVFKNDLSVAPNALALPEGHIRLNNVLLAPLVVKNETLGFLSLGNKVGGFMEKDTEPALALAKLAAIGLRNWQMARELEQSEERYRMIFNHSPLGIAHFNKDGDIIDCNDKFEKIMGASYRIGPKFNMLKNLKDASMLEAMRIGVSGEIGYYEGDYFSIRGQKLTPMRALFRSIRAEDGVFLGGVGIFEDITQIRAAEKTLLQSERVKAVAGLAGGVAHNFNNLLQIIMGNVELSLMDIEAGRSSNLQILLKQIRNTVKLGAETVRRLQTFAKVRQEDTKEDYKLFDISDVVGKALAESAPSWKSDSVAKLQDIAVESDLSRKVL